MEVMTLVKLSFMKMISLQLPFVYEKPLAFTTNFLLLRLILLVCKLSGMLAKLCATELCFLAFCFLCCAFSGVKENIISKTELGLNSFEHITSNSQCLAECINLLIKKLINIHVTHWKNAWVLLIDLWKQSDCFSESEIELHAHYTSGLIYESHNYLTVLMWFILSSLRILCLLKFITIIYIYVL